MTKWGLFNWMKFNFCVSWQDINKLEAFSNSATFGRGALLKRGIQVLQPLHMVLKGRVLPQGSSVACKTPCRRHLQERWGDTDPLSAGRHWIVWGKHLYCRKVEMLHNTLGSEGMLGMFVPWVHCRQIPLVTGTPTGWSCNSVSDTGPPMQEKPGILWHK